MHKGLLVVISGPSGCGKGTICKQLLKKNKNINISISATTRKPRNGEIDGINYFFIDKEKFKRMIKANDFLEYAYVHGNFYGTPKSFVLNKLKNGKNILLEIDVQGALQVKKIYSDAVLVFISPPSMDELKRRIVRRGTESRQDICKRFNTAYEELKYIEKYDYLVVNDKLADAVRKVNSIIYAEQCKVTRKKLKQKCAKEE